MHHAPIPQPLLAREASPTWQAISLILDSPTLRLRVDYFVDHTFEILDEGILAEPWSSGERFLVEFALSLLSPNHRVFLYDGIGILDPDNARRVTDALAIAYGN
jgi:hypothetical protein